MNDTHRNPSSAYARPERSPFPRFMDFPLIRHRQIRCKCKAEFSPRVRFGLKDDEVPVECRNCRTLLYVMYSATSPRFVVAEVSDADVEYMQAQGMNERQQLHYLLTETVREAA